MSCAPRPLPPRSRARPTRRRSSAGGSSSSSGQLSLRPDHAEIVGDTIQEQTEQVFENLGAILEAAGSSLEQLVKTTVYLVDLSDFHGMNEVYARHVGDRPPARATIEVSALPSGAKVEIEAIAEL